MRNERRLRISAIQRDTHKILACLFWLGLYFTLLVITFAWNALSPKEAHAVSGYFMGFAFGAFAHEFFAMVTGQTSEIRRYAVDILRTYHLTNANGEPVARKKAWVLFALLCAIFVVVMVGLYETIKFQLVTSYTLTLTVASLIGATAASEIAMPYLSMVQAKREARRMATRR